MSRLTLSQESRCPPLLRLPRPQARQPADQNLPPDVAEPVFSQEWVAELYAEMFVEGAAGPVASGQTDVVREVTGNILKLTWAYVQGLAQDHINALSKSFGNFDRVVALGWLLGDAVGLPLMERKQAHTIGLKAKYEAGKIKSKEASIPREAKKAAGRLGATDPKRQQLLSEADKQVEELLCTPVELPFPEAAQPSAPRPSGSRKRAREPEVSATDVIAEAEADVLQAEKTVKWAAVAKERAAKDEEAKAKVAVRMTVKLEELGEAARATTIQKQVKQWKHNQQWLKLHTTTERRWNQAVLASKDAEIAWLEAQLAERDAQAILSELLLDTALAHM